MNTNTRPPERLTIVGAHHINAARMSRVVAAVTAAIGVAGMLIFAPAGAAAEGATAEATPPSLEQTRTTMGKWIETQQIISKERKDWQQGKDILLGRIDLIKREIAALEEKIRDAETSAKQADAKRADLTAEHDILKNAGLQLANAASMLEADVQNLHKALPEPIREKLEPLYQRIPKDAAQTQVSPAERYQNILGILNEINKSNSEITVNFEVHNLANGKPSEVRAVYIGLAQGYYVSTGGEGGISQPTSEGWTWKPSAAVGGDVLRVLEIIQGKQTAAFVPLPVKIQ